jgi:hypothetical protein
MSPHGHAQRGLVRHGALGTPRRMVGGGDRSRCLGWSRQGFWAVVGPFTRAAHHASATRADMCSAGRPGSSGYTWRRMPRYPTCGRPFLPDWLRCPKCRPHLLGLGSSRSCWRPISRSRCRRGLGHSAPPPSLPAARGPRPERSQMRSRGSCAASGPPGSPRWTGVARCLGVRGRWHVSSGPQKTNSPALMAPLGGGRACCADLHPSTLARHAAARMHPVSCGAETDK